MPPGNACPAPRRPLPQGTRPPRRTGKGCRRTHPQPGVTAGARQPPRSLRLVAAIHGQILVLGASLAAYRAHAAKRRAASARTGPGKRRTPSHALCKAPFLLPTQATLVVHRWPPVPGLARKLGTALPLAAPPAPTTGEPFRKTQDGEASDVVGTTPRQRPGKPCTRPSRRSCRRGRSRACTRRAAWTPGTSCRP